MGSKSQKCQHDNGDNSVNIAGKTPQFFKIIIEDSIHEGRLGIPVKFVKYHGNCLSGRMILRVPNGTKWVIELSKTSNEAWLEKGWHEFSEYYSLKHGYLLVFKYEGNSQFTVLIFDRSLVEIEYPGSSNCDVEVQEPLMNETGTPEFHTSLLSSQPNGSQTEVIVIEDSDCSIQELEGKLNNFRKPSHLNISRALQAAKKFTSSNPWFNVVLKSNRMQNVPMEFIRKYMESESQTVLLKVEDKFWQLRLNVYARKSTAIFSAGWSAFVRENSLRTGDVCVFELVQRRMLNVHIFRKRSSKNV